MLFAVAGGDRIVEDTVVEKPEARWLSDAAWGGSSQQSTVVCGVSVVLLGWTDGQGRMPLAGRCWHKGGLSQGERARELLSDARHRLRGKPPCVLCDAWSPSQPLRQRRRDAGGDFVCQLQQQRRCEGAPLSRELWPPSGHATGQRSGALKVRVVRSRRKDSATNRRSLRAKEVRTHDTKRHAVEASCRARKSPVRLEACQAGYRRSTEDTSHLSEGAQAHHMALGLVAYLMLERERLDRGLTWVRLKRYLILTGSSEPLSALERVRKLA